MQLSVHPPFARVIRHSDICFKTLKVFLPPENWFDYSTSTLRPVQWNV